MSNIENIRIGMCKSDTVLISIVDELKFVGRFHTHLPDLFATGTIADVFAGR